MEVIHLYPSPPHGWHQEQMMTMMMMKDNQIPLQETINLGFI